MQVRTRSMHKKAAAAAAPADSAQLAEIIEAPEPATPPRPSRRDLPSPKGPPRPVRQQRPPRSSPLPCIGLGEESEHGSCSSDEDADEPIDLCNGAPLPDPNDPPVRMGYQLAIAAIGFVVLLVAAQMARVAGSP